MPRQNASHMPRAAGPVLPLPSPPMPVFFRPYCTSSGCVFNKERGFVARGDDIFDPVHDVVTAKEILANPLSWQSHHIPSPPISVSTGREKPRRLASSLRRYHGVTVDVSIAEILYDVEPSSAYHMMTVAEKLGVDVSRECIVCKECCDSRMDEMHIWPSLAQSIPQIRQKSLKNAAGRRRRNMCGIIISS
ncbi:hypothetical protein K438DRAFT_1776104 [Mycena galopus ATCC 62051]|nr:hypothetical protein K438DRAFT_1776104 [Mycena galopus ATCC 62051]